MLLSTFFKKKDSHPHPRPVPRYEGKISVKTLRDLFSDCMDFIVRDVHITGHALGNVSVCYIDGMVSGVHVSENIIRPLTESPLLINAPNARSCMDLMLHGGVYNYAARERDSLDDIVWDLTHGSCAIILERKNVALTFETKSAEHRSIEQPTVEKSVLGSKDSFVEIVRINTSLVRNKLRDPDLKLKQTTVGRRSSTSVAVMYMQNIAKPELVQEIQRRLDSIDIDGITSVGDLEDYIVDNPRSLFPQVMHTERPDRFAIGLLNGQVGLLADGLPFGLLLPGTLPEFMRVPDDEARHALVASFLLVLRWLAFGLSLILPAMLVAVALYHQEMIPSKLLLSMIAAKQQVPFTAAAEVLGMLLAFELLQEAGLRLPSSVGQTVSIIGALIVGQSAVEARVISPIAVIVVALSGIAGYTQPNQEIGAALRICRLVLVIVTLLAGMFGLMMGLVLLLWCLCSMESFGLCYMSPLVDSKPGDILKTLLRFPLRKNKFRDPRLTDSNRRRQA
ncbi:MAG: spore germination protein [Eubacteriales bacterium]|nr:spore germination protein [Eubacteriales bacterium]